MGEKKRFTWKEKEKWLARPDFAGDPYPKPNSAIASNPTRGESSGTKVMEVYQPELHVNLEKIQEFEKEKLGLSEVEKFVGDASIGVFDVSMAVSEGEEDDMCSVFSTMEDFKGDGSLLIEVPCEETETKNFELVMVDEDAQAIATANYSEIEEIIELSLEGVNFSACDVEYCSQWVANNVQKFGKMIGVFLASMENLSYLFFSEIEKKKCFKKRKNWVVELQGS